MADNVTTQSGTLATVPASTKISTDEDSTNGHVQRVKLAVSDDGSSVHISGDANGLQVQGAAVEDSAATGNPNLAGGRYDATPRTLDDGDAGAIAIDADGAVRISDGGNSITIDNAALTTLAGAVSGTEFQVDIVSSALPSGASTSANQSTANTALAAIQAAVEVIDNTISGNEMQVDIVSSALPSGAATSANQSTSNTVLAAIQAAVETLDNAISGSEMQVDVVSLPNEGQQTMASSISVTVASDQSDISIDDGGNSITVDGTVTANLGATDNAVLDQIEANTSYGDNTGGGTESGALRVTLASDSTGVLSVDDNGGSLTVDGTVTASNTAGNVADDAADSGNPVKIGAVVKPMDSSDPGSASAENDRVHLIADENRRLYVNNAHPNLWDQVENNSTAQTNNEIKTAPGSGLYLYVTDIIMSTDTDMNIKLVQDTGGTPADVAGPFYFAANGGIAISFNTPIKISENVNLGYTSSAAGNHTIQVHGFSAP